MKWLPIYCRLAGSADAVTGLLLVAAPITTLGLMGAGAPADPVWVRWVGAFVAAVGVSYWLPDLLPDRSLQHARRRSALEFTTLVRLAVGFFVVWALSTSRLELAFASVAATDLGLAMIQIALLRHLHKEAP